QGQVAFDVPFAQPAGLPVISVTATDPQGNTSEVSALRRGTVQAPTQAVRLVPGQPLIFSDASGHAIALRDAAAGPWEPAWDLTLSVSAGTLELSNTAGLTGAGNGTGSLAYSGTLATIDAALEGMRFTPPPGYQGNPSLIMDARSEGAAEVQSQVQIVVTDGRFTVSTRADSGPGSLRQAILDSNAATGASNTIDFAIPGQGVQKIDLVSPLPRITNSVLIDGSLQPGYAGTPLIALDTVYAANPDQLTLNGSDVSVRGMAITGFALGTG